MFRSRIKYRIILSFVLLTALSLSGLGAYLLHYFHTRNMETETRHLVTNAAIVETTLEDILYVPTEQTRMAEEIAKISAMTHLRVTILDAAGDVVADSWEDASRLDNHLEREEIRAAAGQPYATAIRYSATTGQNMLYVAVPVFKNGAAAGFVRTASALTPIEENYKTIRTIILTSLFATVLLALGGGCWLAGRHTKPVAAMTEAAQEIAAGKFDRRIRIHTGDELEFLAQTVNKLTATLEDKIIEASAETKKLALILEHMDNAVLLLDAYGNVATANRSARSSFDITSDLMGKHSISVIGNSALTEAAQEVVASGHSKSLKLKLKTNGQPKTYEIFFAPIVHYDGKHTGVLSVFHDISAMQEIYDQQVEFVANASHELKTPLTSIQGFAETLLDGALEQPETARKFVGIMHTEAQRMSRLVQDLLQLAKLDAKEYRAQIQFEEIAAAPFFAALRQKLAPQLAAKQQRFAIDLAPDIAQLYANYDWLMQLMVNLLENAVKYTPPSGEIRIACRRESGKIHVRVTDSGVGIAPQDLPFVFERFYRSDKARTRSAGGSGIGLALARSIAALFGGDLTVESQLHAGTTFAFDLTEKETQL